MCRGVLPTHTNVVVEHNLVKMIRSKRQGSFDRQLQKLKDEGMLLADQIQIKFEYGNKHVMVPDQDVRQGSENKHRWTMFLRTVDRASDGPAFKYLEKVRYGLHPTFGVEYRDVKASTGNEEFEMSYVGWGTFWIPITLYFKRGLRRDEVTLNHYLCFDKPVSSQTTIVTLSKAKLQNLS